ncbi:hypothetical protein MAR_012141 [Mya arenaria]|uniref:Uncharacterized protein n=1 Tax=Mya arenaria TaxID=6604 RepID=A0ABY7FW85_MYAAR|nr:hypothetical protein MAR_012141 [Mya arenaria]
MFASRSERIQFGQTPIHFSFCLPCQEYFPCEQVEASFGRSHRLRDYLFKLGVLV